MNLVEQSGEPWQVVKRRRSGSTSSHTRAKSRSGSSGEFGPGKFNDSLWINTPGNVGDTCGIIISKSNPRVKIFTLVASRTRSRTKN